MPQTKIKKKFDCLEFKRRAQMEIYEEIRRLSPPQQIEYFNREAARGPLSGWWRAIRRASVSNRPD
ncbi:MAG: hypothetical protein HY922_00165 [Elusimicrobia bacterium]|nr:hypothetical protein [Elusimicrobiota bacterium]